MKIVFLRCWPSCNIPEYYLTTYMTEYYAPMCYKQSPSQYLSFTTNSGCVKNASILTCSLRPGSPPRHQWFIIFSSIFGLTFSFFNKCFRDVNNPPPFGEPSTNKTCIFVFVCILQVLTRNRTDMLRSCIMCKKNHLTQGRHT